VTKELATTFALIVLTGIMWAGWFVFEKNSILKQQNFSEKTIQSINPNLKTEVLEQLE